MDRDEITRTDFLKIAAWGFVGAALPEEASTAPEAEASSGEITDALIKEAEPLIGVQFPPKIHPRVAQALGARMMLLVHRPDLTRVLALKN